MTFTELRLERILRRVKEIKRTRLLMAKVLLEAEWGYDFGLKEFGCPICENSETSGHTPECEGEVAFDLARKIVKEDS